MLVRKSLYQEEIPILLRMEENKDMVKKHQIKVSGSKQKHYLPQEIVYDILSKLPRKSLLRFQSVCRNWRDTITDPDFEERNVQQLMSNIRINVYSREYGNYAYKYASFKLEEKGQSAKQVTSSYLTVTPEFGVWIEDSCNNLLLCRAQADMPLKIKLCVFDNTTHQLKHLLPEIEGYYDHTSRCSFVCNAYKLIIFHYYDLLSLAATCSFFSLNSGNRSWRMYKLPGCQRAISSRPLISLNGVFYWIARDFGSHFSVFIQPMEVETEEFLRIIQVPCQPRTDFRVTVNYNLLEIKGSLCLMHAASHDELNIWFLKDSVRSRWIQQHKIFVSSMVHRPSSLTSFIYDIFHPLLVVESCKTTYILVAMEDESKLSWYNMETRELTHIAIKSDSTSCLRTIIDPWAMKHFPIINVQLGCFNFQHTKAIREPHY